MVDVLSARHPERFAAGGVPALLAERERLRPGHPLLIWEPFDGPPASWTYAEFADGARRVAAGLRRRGVRAGEHVVLHLDNCPDLLLAWFGCALAGAVAVTTNARASADELSYFAGHSGAVGILTEQALEGSVAAAAPGRWVVSVRPGGPDLLGQLGADPEAGFEPRRPTDPVSVQFTSGTTARPKGVVWTHANAVWAGAVGAAHSGLTADDVQLVHSPLSHTMGLSWQALATFWAGGTVVVQPGFSASRFWEVSLRHRCTWTWMVPFCARALMALDPGVPEHHYRHWGGPVTDPPYAAQFRVPVLGAWGMTEVVSQGIIARPDHPVPPLSIGRPVPEYELAVRDDAGELAQPGDTGELVVRGVPGVSVFAGYLHDPQATAAAFDEDGWFRTGDCVTPLADGSVRWAGRSKDMLKIGGENVGAAELEAVIAQVPGVREAAVVGRADPMLDEVPVAFVIAGAEDGELADRVVGACREKLADFKVPREVRVVAELPRSLLGKVAKNVLREQVAAEAVTERGSGMSGLTGVGT